MKEMLLKVGGSKGSRSSPRNPPSLIGELKEKSSSKNEESMDSMDVNVSEPHVSFELQEESSQHSMTSVASTDQEEVMKLKKKKPLKVKKPVVIEVDSSQESSASGSQSLLQPQVERKKSPRKQKPKPSDQEEQRDKMLDISQIKRERSENWSDLANTTLVQLVLTDYMIVNGNISKSLTKVDKENKWKEIAIAVSA